MKKPLTTRQDYHFFCDISTRWADNDIYGHVNNVVYYAYFDSIVNTFLIQQGGLNIHDGNIIGLAVNSQCNYFSPVAFPDSLEGGFRVNRIGTSSVEYGVGIFKTGEDNVSAEGTFTHVYVDRESRRPIPLDGQLREALDNLRKLSFSKEK